MNSVVERFLDKVSPEPNTGCWLWTACCNIDGYGQFWSDSKTICAHRFSYEHYRGSIPEGLHLDHLCKVRCCTNPDHLEAVTCLENIRRGAGNSHKGKTHCKRGHEFTKENTYKYKNGRQCKECRRFRRKEYRRKERESK